MPLHVSNSPGSIWNMHKLAPMPSDHTLASEYNAAVKKFGVGAKCTIKSVPSDSQCFNNADYSRFGPYESFRVDHYATVAGVHASHVQTVSRSSTTRFMGEFMVTVSNFCG